ncbi:MAG: tail fiber domain-containing protein [Elusimicrobia bacterium]|nr:tail fiber domain-containing protein [Elusimicrobiota bacterium]
MMQAGWHRLTAAVLAVSLPTTAFAETLTMSTTFPSPAGIYNAIVTTGNGTGNNNTVLNRNGGFTILVPPPNTPVGVGTAGRVVVGAATPSTDSIVTIVSPTAASGFNQLRVKQAGTSGTILHGYDTVGNFFLNNQDNAFLGLSTANTERMRIMNTGQVGVGSFSSGIRFYGYTATANEWAGYFRSDNGPGLYAQTSQAGQWAGQAVSINGHGFYGYSSAAGHWAGYFVSQTGYGVYGHAGGAGMFGVYGYAENQGYGGYFYSTGAGGIGSFNGNANGTYSYLAYRSGPDWSLYGNGYIVAAGINTASDRRLKEHIEPINGSLGKVLSLRPVSFHWKPGIEAVTSAKGKDFGFIGQEVEKVIPEIVKDVPGGSIKSGNGADEIAFDSFKIVDYVRVVPFLTGAVQELHTEMAEGRGKRQAEIESLQKENAALRGRVSVLEDRIQRLEKRGAPPTDAKRPVD